jgi:hypothetical protein
MIFHMVAIQNYSFKETAETWDIPSGRSGTGIIA